MHGRLRVCVYAGSQPTQNHPRLALSTSRALVAAASHSSRNGRSALQRSRYCAAKHSPLAPSYQLRRG